MLKNIGVLSNEITEIVNKVEAWEWLPTTTPSHRIVSKNALAGLMYHEDLGQIEIEQIKNVFLGNIIYDYYVDSITN
jgi:hypothetical protein